MNRRVASPSLPLGPHTNVVASPGLNSTTPSRRAPMRSFGPGRSCRIATWRPARPAASRTSRAVSACSSALPWEKFSRATSIPASTMRARTSGSREAGPMVATIFVRRCICVARYRSLAADHVLRTGERSWSGNWRRPRSRARDVGIASDMANAESRTETPKNGEGRRFDREDDAPDQPTDLPKEAYPAILKRTFKQFSEDQLTTWAAALTYFGVLSLFPMLLALVSVLGVIGPSATQPLLDNLNSVAPGPAKDILTNVLTSLESNKGGSTVALIIGIVL